MLRSAQWRPCINRTDKLFCFQFSIDRNQNICLGWSWSKKSSVTIVKGFTSVPVNIHWWQLGIVVFLGSIWNASWLPISNLSPVLRFIHNCCTIPRFRFHERLPYGEWRSLYLIFRSFLEMFTIIFHPLIWLPTLMIIDRQSYGTCKPALNNTKTSFQATSVVIENHTKFWRIFETSEKVVNGK